MDVKADIYLTLKFRELSLGTFWLSVKKEWTVISEMPRRILLPFSTPVYQNWSFVVDGNRFPNKEQLRTTEEEVGMALSAVSQCTSLLRSTDQAQLSHWSSKSSVKPLAY
jgi:hypothetical protein